MTSLPVGWNGISFGSVAQMYDAARPVYPAESVEWMLGSPSAGAGAVIDVADVGAGTGKMTEVLVGLGHRVTAIDPDADMLTVLSRKFPHVRTVVGRAEDIPLPDASVDALVLAQAFHWVDPPAAFVEIARVLRPGGWLGVVWNDRDEADEWTPQISRAWGERARAVGASFDHHVPAHPMFGAVESHRATHSQELTEDLLIALTASRSYVIALAPRERERLFDDMRALVARHHDATGEANITIRYVTHSYRMRKK
jgi:ubiquinone/menaquinone biosynthesis C-methylase UbiE